MLVGPSRNSSGVGRTLVALALVGLLAAGGCAGSPTSRTSWSDTAEQAVGQLVSGLGTAKVVLEANTAARLTHAYAVGTLTDALETADKEVGAFDVVQPPDDLHPLADRITRELYDAALLLREVRTEVTSPDLTRDAAQELLDRVEDALDSLDTLSATVSEVRR